MDTMTATRDLVKELSRVEGKAEIIHGEIVHLPLAGAMPGQACGAILFSLHRYSKRTRHGHSFTSCCGFLVDLPHRKSFCPDTGYYVGSDAGMGFYQSAPIFAVEVRNEEDYGPAAEREMEAKRTDYFAAGTLVVWDVDLLGGETVRVFRDSEAGTPASVYQRGQTAEAEPAVPGWTMPVDDLFAS